MKLPLSIQLNPHVYVEDAAGVHALSLPGEHPACETSLQTAAAVVRMVNTHGPLVLALNDLLGRVPTCAPDGSSQLPAIEAARQALAAALSVTPRRLQTLPVHGRVEADAGHRFCVSCYCPVPGSEPLFRCESCERAATGDVEAADLAARAEHGL